MWGRGLLPRPVGSMRRCPVRTALRLVAASARVANMQGWVPLPIPEARAAVRLAEVAVEARVWVGAWSGHVR